MIDVSETRHLMNIQRQVQMERLRHRHQPTRPSLSRALRLVHDVNTAEGFRPDLNRSQHPTIGVDAEENTYDPSPVERWAPQFRRKVEAQLKSKPKVTVKEPETSPDEEGADEKETSTGVANPLPPELPGDPRKDPAWKGNKPVKLPSNDNISSNVVMRYNMDKDPLSSAQSSDRRSLLQSHAKTGRHGPIQKYWS